MKNKKVLILSILIILITIVTGISLSYAYWTSIHVSDNTNVLNSGCLNIEFKSISDDLFISRAYPTTKKYFSLDHNNYGYYDFVVTNTCNNVVNYNINLETLYGSDLDEGNITLMAKGYDIKSLKINDVDDYLDSLTDEEIDNSLIFDDTRYIRDYMYVEPTLDEAILSHLIYTGNLDAKSSHLFTFTAFLTYNRDSNVRDENELQEKIYKSKVTITSAFDPNSVPKNGAVLRKNVFANELANENVKTIRPYSDTITPEIISNAKVISDGTGINAYAWFDDNGETLYYYSDAKKIYMVEDRFGGLGSDDMWNPFSNVENIDLSLIDTSMMTSMDSMFHGLRYLSNLDISSFDTSNVTSMRDMFYCCYNLSNIDLSNFNTSKVNNMHNMFYYCNSLTFLDVNHFITINVTDMSGMFLHCSSLVNLDVSNFNTSFVTDMGSMFEGCRGLSSLTLINFVTNNVINMGDMFYDCSSLESLDLSNFNTSKVTSMYGMFSDCDSLVNLNVTSFDTSNVTRMARMFQYCYSLQYLDLSSFDTSKVDFHEIVYGFSNNIFSHFSQTDSLVIQLDCVKGKELEEYINQYYSIQVICLNN